MFTEGNIFCRINLSVHKREKKLLLPIPPCTGNVLYPMILLEGSSASLKLPPSLHPNPAAPRKNRSLWLVCLLLCFWLSSAKSFDQWFYWILVPVGVIGNILSFLVIMKFNILKQITSSLMFTKWEFFFHFR